MRKMALQSEALNNSVLSLEWNGTFLNYRQYGFGFDTRDLFPSKDILYLGRLVGGTDPASIYCPTAYDTWYSCFMAETVLSTISREAVRYPKALESDAFLQELMQQAHDRSFWHETRKAPSIGEVWRQFVRGVPDGDRQYELLDQTDEEHPQLIRALHFIPGLEPPSKMYYATLLFYTSGVLLQYDGKAKFMKFPILYDKEHTHRDRYTLSAISCIRLLLREAGVTLGGDLLQGVALGGDMSWGEVKVIKELTCLGDINSLLSCCVVHDMSY